MGLLSAMKGVTASPGDEEAMAEIQTSELLNIGVGRSPLSVFHNWFKPVKSTASERNELRERVHAYNNRAEK